jgi:Fe-S cluster biosynthesis and repair protein YggX
VVVVVLLREYIHQLGHCINVRDFTLLIQERKLMMTDKEFIIFLCKQINNICSDGDNPDMEIIAKELEARNIDFDEVFDY